MASLKSIEKSLAPSEQLVTASTVVYVEVVTRLVLLVYVAVIVCISGSPMETERGPEVTSEEIPCPVIVVAKSTATVWRSETRLESSGTPNSFDKRVILQNENKTKQKAKNVNKNSKLKIKKKIFPSQKKKF